MTEGAQGRILPLQPQLAQGPAEVRARVGGPEVPEAGACGRVERQRAQRGPELGGVDQRRL
eukprot:5559082-Pyramimonas_sp.AAC.1